VEQGPVPGEYENEGGQSRVPSRTSIRQRGPTPVDLLERLEIVDEVVVRQLVRRVLAELEWERGCDSKDVRRAVVCRTGDGCRGAQA
jgi:hypothetical protein